MKYPLRFVVSYVQRVMQHFESRTVQKAPLQSTHIERTKWCRMPQLYQLLSEKRSIHYSLLWATVCSIRYTAVRIKNCLKSTSAIKIATMKNMDDFRYKGKPSRATTISTLFVVSEDKWDTKEDTGKSMKNAVCQKAPVGPKRHRTVKKSSP